MLSANETDDAVNTTGAEHFAADHVLHGAAVVFEHGPADEHLHGHVPEGRVDGASTRAAGELVPHVAWDHDLLISIVGRCHGHEGADDQPVAERRYIDRPAAPQRLPRQHARGYGMLSASQSNHVVDSYRLVPNSVEGGVNDA